jgi:hypothetical protein
VTVFVLPSRNRAVPLDVGGFPNADAADRLGPSRRGVTALGACSAGETVSPIGTHLLRDMGCALTVLNIYRLLVSGAGRPRVVASLPGA